MEVIYSDKAKEHILFWKRSGQKTIQNRISKLIEDILLHPYTGIGKPEALKYELTGYWSRKINDEHRLVYRIENDTLYILQLKGHYEK